VLANLGHVQQEQPTGRAARSGRTRQAILSAARERFTRGGYAHTTVRAVAADAHIDPSMVMRYFGSKQGLFAAAADFDLALPDLVKVPVDQLGATAVRHFLARWEGEQTTDSLRVLLATAVTDEAAAAQMQQIFRAQLEPVVAAAGHDPASAALRSGLVATQILGLALCRYVLRLPPVVALEPEAVVRWLGPVIQTYLADPAPPC
jgi:AcrR family transcriptional regulator